MIARVFPSKNGATPDDALAFFDAPPMFGIDGVTEVHISVSFTWEVRRAEWLSRQWEHIAPVKVGGPAFNQPSGDFVPGMYLKNGWVITSRGCKNKCWFCSVHKREPELKELPICDGWIVQDDNLLSCSEKHIRSVASMLKRQPCPARLMGLEAAILKPWHIELFSNLRIESLYFAYDTPNDLEPLIVASTMLKDAGFNRNKMFCYCLIGSPNDTFQKAESRLLKIWELGFMPFAMLWRDSGEKDNRTDDWKAFARIWSRPAIIRTRMKKVLQK